MLDLAFEVGFLYCCGKPLLEVVKRLSTDDHDSRSLCRCENCGAWWFHRFYEYIHFYSDLPDDQITWYARLTDDDAKDVLRSDDFRGMSFLADRPCFRKDERGIATIHGMPWP